MILLDNNYLFSILISLLLINGLYNLAYKFRKKTDSVLLIDNESFEQEMYHEGGCWWYSLILQEENCIEIQEIIITAQEGGSNGR